jgi:hypothetical protein
MFHIRPLCESHAAQALLLGVAIREPDASIKLVRVLFALNGFTYP